MMTGMNPVYDVIGRGYARHRRPDPRIAAHISRALGEARSIVNVGAGTGSYEPRDRMVVAVEPSKEMISQRPEAAAPVVRGSAEQLPFGDDEFDAALAVLTIHHWRDLEAGLREMKRVARQRIVILTWDPDSDPFWLTRDYFPDLLRIDRSIFPSIHKLGSVLGSSDVCTVPVPHDCTDGFLGAYWRRPEAYLDPRVRQAISTFARLDDVDTRLDMLRRDIDAGVWLRRNGDLLGRDELDVGYRLVVARHLGAAR